MWDPLQTINPGYRCATDRESGRRNKCIARPQHDCSYFRFLVSHFLFLISSFLLLGWPLASAPRVHVQLASTRRSSTSASTRVWVRVDVTRAWDREITTSSELERWILICTSGHMKLGHAAGHTRTCWFHWYKYKKRAYQVSRATTSPAVHRAASPYSVKPDLLRD